MKTLVLALVLASSPASATTLAEIIGDVARVRVDLLSKNHRQFFRTAEVPELLRALDPAQPLRPGHRELQTYSPDTVLVFFDKRGQVTGQLSFYGPIGRKNFLFTFGFTAQPRGWIVPRDPAAIERLIAR